MDDHTQSMKGLVASEPEEASLHRMSLPQALPIAGDLPSHALPIVTSPSLGFGLPSSEVRADLLHGNANQLSTTVYTCILWVILSEWN